MACENMSLPLYGKSLFCPLTESLILIIVLTVIGFHEFLILNTLIILILRHSFWTAGKDGEVVEGIKRRLA